MSPDAVLRNQVATQKGVPVEIEPLLAGIPLDTTVVEFFSYEHNEIDDGGPARRTSGEQRISAFVLRGRDKTIRRIELGKALELRRDVRRLVAAMPFGTEQDPLQDVSQAVVPKLLAALPEACQKLVIVPDGITGGIPYACLAMPEDSQPLVSRYELSIQTSVDQLSIPQPVVERSSNVVAVGGVDYGPLIENQPLQFKEIPGTSAELQVLQRHFEGEGVKLLGGENATQEQLFGLLDEAQVVHLATHAYVTDFARNAVTNNALNSGAVRVSVDQRSPLLAARVALSGANRWETEPGTVITGERFATTDLGRAKLVVLSACESGVGERVLGEGVFGLPRAFHIAGASDVVATLWPVSDADAVAFMEKFYSYLVDQQMTPAAALRSAQLAIIADPPPEPDRTAAARRGIKFDFAASGESTSDTTDAADSSPSRDGNVATPTPRSTWAAFF